jgi:hypothetical protein
MSLLALMTAAAVGTVTVPAPAGNPNDWFGASDIPKGEYRAGNDGVFVIKAIVSAGGKVDACHARPTGPSQADRDDFCARLKRKAKFGNVVNESGTPVYYVMEDSYAYVLPESWHRFGAPPEPNAVIDVEKLPDAKDGKTDVLVNVSVDANGDLRKCNPASNSMQPALGRVACGQLTSSWAPLPETNAAGDAIPYVRQMWVEFRAKKKG